MKDDQPYEARPEDGRDADLAALLRAVGPRDQPSAEMSAEVRAAVAAEWRAAVAARQAVGQSAAQPVAQRRRAQLWLAIAASVTAVAIAIGFALPRLTGSADSFATIARVDGRAEIRHQDEAAWQPMTAGASVAEADMIRTLDDGRVAVRREDGLEVRLDAATQLAFNAGDRATLRDGRVYVDAGRPGTGAGSFILRTPQGDVRHLGTQYAASLRQGVLQVAVREGSIVIDRGQSPVVARAGEALRVATHGPVQRSSVPAYGDAWRWAEAAAPQFAIDGRSLDEFLAWAARETGRDVVYASADAAREAEATRLKGSIAGLSPEAAVTAVLASEPGLRHQIAGGQIRIERTGR